MIAVRPATSDDARFVWEVNSHPSVREQSIRTEPIPWESHVRWFERALANEAMLMLVAEDDGHPVAVVRFQATPEGALISVAVAPGARGRGIGTRVIEEATRRAAERKMGAVAIALVRPSNAASLRAFSAAGYAPAGRVTEEGVELDRLERRL